MSADPKAQQPTRLLVLLLALVLFGFFSISASQYVVQRLSQKTTRWTADKHAQIHMARQLEMRIKEIQADFFLLPTLSSRSEQEISKTKAQILIKKALQTLDLLEHGGSISPPEAITFLFGLPANTLFTYAPEKNRARLAIIATIHNQLLQVQKDLKRLDLLLIIHSDASPEQRLHKTKTLMTILNNDKEVFSTLGNQTDEFIASSLLVLETLKQESKAKIKRYQAMGIAVAGATFILVAFLGSRLIVQIINTNKILRITRDNMAADYRKQKALNSILAITHEPLPLKEKLAKSLDIILQSLFSSTTGEGAIFLSDHHRRKIVLQAHRGIHEGMKCLHQDAAFGSCLCGIAAESGEIIECGSDDPRHSLRHHDMAPHNHFCLPIMVEEKPLGVLLIHLERDVLLPQSDKNFLGAVAHSMAALIKQQMAEEKLAKAELDRIALFESSNEAILLLKNNEVLRCNKAAALLFGLQEPAEIVSTSPTELLARHDEGASLQTFLSLINIAMQQGTAQSECLMQRRDDSTFEAALTFTPILLDGNTILYLVVRDISAKKEEEQALLTAKKQAEKASQAKSNFLAAMSHEIRTPLNAIIGMTHLTMRQELEPEIHENIETIHTAADSLLSLINDILDITKIEEGQLLLEENPFSLEDLVDKLDAIFAEQFRATNVDFQIKIADGTPTKLIGDVLRISQILNNLLTNALKFTEKGAVILSLSSPRHDDQQAVIQFLVEDSGIGISEDTLPIIFDEFTQGGSARQFGGLGLGLSISRRLADIMGGKLWATSTPHQGSSFFFEVQLPRALSQESALGSHHKKTDFFRKAAALQDAKILVVEDNDINRRVVLKILETVGARPEYARNGREAVDRISHQHQAVLMDIEMPVLDGIQATREIRMDRRFADIPIIAMTAHAMVDDRNRCLEAGMNDYLTKPIEPIHFIDVLEKWLDPQSKESQLRNMEESRRNAERQLHSLVKGKIVLDMGTGIAKMGGDKNLYLEILADFLTLHSETPAEISAALSQGKMEKAMATAHLLKGVASTLRAYDLQVRAKDMEHMLRQGVTDKKELEQAMSELTIAADLLLTRIKEVLGQPKTALN